MRASRRRFLKRLAAFPRIGVCVYTMRPEILSAIRTTSCHVVRWTTHPPARPKRIAILLATALVLLHRPGAWAGTVEAGSAESSTRLQVLVSLPDENVIARHLLNEESGELIRTEEFPLQGGPGPLYVTPDRTRIYVGLLTSNQVALLGVGPDGELALEDVASVGFRPVHLSVSPTGDFLWAASYTDSAWAVFPVHGDGTVDALSRSRVSGVTKAHQIVVWARESFVIVPALGLDSVLVYNEERALEEGTPEPAYTLRLPDGAGPRHVVSHPSQPRFFVANESHSTVTMVEWDAREMAFVAGPEVRSVPADYTGPNTCAQIKISPDARHLYVSNRGHDSIAVFEILDATPGLRLEENVATEARPWAFALDSSARWLIAAGYDSGYMTLYERDRSSGLLTKKARAHVGKQSRWVEIFAPRGAP